MVSLSTRPRKPLHRIPLRSMAAVLLAQAATLAFCSENRKVVAVTLRIRPHMAKYSSSLRVLIVDDEPLMRWSLAQALADAGHVTIEAGDGQAAIRAVSPSVDVILLDYRLPDSNDLALLSTLRRLVPDSAIVVMTAHSTPDLVTGALRLGAHRVLAKPFEMHDLVACVERANGCRPV